VDATLLTVLLILVFATMMALIQARRRDRCLKSFDAFHVTLAEKNGNLAWGNTIAYPTGLEITYVAPVGAREGHLERSFIFYKEQYEAMEALYRYPEGLPPGEQERRAEVIRKTVRPGVLRRLGRRMRNWSGMVRDALVQAAGLVIGAAQAKRPGALTAQGSEGMKTISKEVVGQTGTAYDPLLEKHLFRPVVLEVTGEGGTRSYCGWLKDYTTQFIEVVDAFANDAGAACPTRAYPVGSTDAPAEITVEEQRLHIINEGRAVLYVEEVRAGERWRRALGCVVPPGATADLTFPPAVPTEALAVHVGTVERIDLVVPRKHAIVRHAADGSEEHRQAATASVMAEVAPPTPKRAAVPEAPSVSSPVPPTEDAPAAGSAPQAEPSAPA
jgi:hypothetical protein